MLSPPPEEKARFKHEQQARLDSIKNRPPVHKPNPISLVDNLKISLEAQRNYSSDESEKSRRDLKELTKRYNDELLNTISVKFGAKNQAYASANKGSMSRTGQASLSRTKQSTKRSKKSRKSKKHKSAKTEASEDSDKDRFD